MSPTEHGQPDGGRQIPAIPLSDANVGSRGEPTIGSLVKDATTSVSTLFRSEVALAKSELVDEAKKAGAGTALLIVAGVLALYSSFFFFFFLAELLDTWVSRWLAFLLVFLFLILLTVVLALVGYIFFKRVRGPKKTMSSFNELSTVLPKKDDHSVGARSGLDPLSGEHPRTPQAREG